MPSRPAHPSNRDAMKMLGKEIRAELDRDSSTSLEIWRMFNNKNGLLPNNRRILNMSWRIYSMNSMKERGRHARKPHKPFSYTNLSLLKQHDTDSLIEAKSSSGAGAKKDPEFDYIEHIRRLSSVEYNPAADFPAPEDPFQFEADNAMLADSFAGSQPINIEYGGGAHVSEPAVFGSVASVASSIGSESMFSPIPHTSSLSSASASAPTSAPGQYSKSFIPLRQPARDREVDSVEELDKLIKFDDNLKDIIDFSKFADDDEQSGSNKKRKMESVKEENPQDVAQDVAHEMRHESEEYPEYSLNSYISTLESSLSKHDKQEKASYSLQAYPTPVSAPSMPSPTISQTPKPQPSSIVSTVLPGSALLSRSSSGFSKSQMPSRPVCENCLTSTTPLWRKTSDNRLLCNACGLFFKLHGIIRPPVRTKTAPQPTQAAQSPAKVRSRPPSLSQIPQVQQMPQEPVKSQDVPLGMEGGANENDWSWLRFD